MDSITQSLRPVLNAQSWQTVNRRLVEKIVAEFSYEAIFKPERLNEMQYRLTVNEGLCYEFVAVSRIYDNFVVKPDTVYKVTEQGRVLVNEAVDFILETQPLTNIDSITLSHFIKEINNTLFADAHILHHHQRTASELLELSYAELEGEMHAHPWFVINKGRIGFSHSDYLQHAPEMKTKTQLAWIAVAKTVASFHAISSLSYQAVIENELSASDRQQFEAQLADEQLNRDDYYLMPIHDWQWQEVICLQFSAEIAAQRLVYLGKSQNHYLPMQSIRTFANVSDKNGYSVKLPLSIFNTAVYRGLPGKRTKVAPLLTEWVKQLCDRDTFLSQDCELILLGEIASMNYEHPHFQKISGAPYQFNELLGVIWRESIYHYLKPNEKAITMASLVHVDSQGKPFVCELIERSGLSAHDWMAQYFEKTLPPLLHCLYRYGMVFSPHGENSILIMTDNKPARLAMKDFVDDINLSKNTVSELADMPAALQNVLLTVEDDYLLQFIQTGLFVVHYRYLSSLLAEHLDYAETVFYQQVNDCILRYQARFPQEKARFERFDLLKPSFDKLCLNRLRVLEVGYGDYGERPEVLAHGQVPNPLYLAQCEPHFTWQADGAPTVTFRKVNLSKDLDTLHRWMNAPHVAEHWRLAKQKEALEKHFSQMLTATHQSLFMISVDGVELAYAETYRAEDDRLATFYDILSGDYGWHLLIGPKDAVGRGYAEPLMRALTTYCFQQPAAKRVLFEPDVRVVPFQRVAPRLGYQNLGTLKMPEKQAYVFAVEKHNYKETP